MSVFRSIIMNSSGGLPTEYQAVTCLKVTDASGSWINLDLPVIWGHKIVMDLQPTLYRSNWTTLACSTFNEGYYRFYYNSEGMAPQANVGIRMSSPNTGVDAGTNATTGLDNQRRTFEMVHRTNELSIKVNGIPTLNLTRTPSSTPTNSGYWRLYSQSGGSDRYRGKIYSTQVYDVSDNLIVDLVPCYKKSTMVAGMYDLINKKFYASSSSTPFLYEL